MESSQMIVDECQELKNIKYKTMLLTGMPIHETKSSNDISNLDKFLEAEKINNNSEPWCKLNKTIKVKKLSEYVDSYSSEHNLDIRECAILTVFLKDSLEKKKLSRVKDVIYDKITGVVKDIPALVYNKSNKHFTLKNIDKRVSTLKSLAPKKVNGTIRHKGVHTKTDATDSASDDDEN
jgi:hypothetical protein